MGDNGRGTAQRTAGTMIRQRGRAAGLATACLLAGVASAGDVGGVGGGGDGGQPATERVHWDEPGPDGHLRGGVVRLPRIVDVEPLAGEPPAVHTIHGDGGDPAVRFDIVFVGDGYTEADLDEWAVHAADLASALLAEPPFDRYAPLIAIHRVDVISAESGVDHDPAFGILRDTALDMGFWCSGIERLLCVNTAKAGLLANLAPGRDLVIAVANSQTYGGAGYAGTTTTSAAHPDSPEIMVHEIGHSLADLGDEYFSEGAYDGPEPAPRNISILDPEAMAAAGTKWAAWLDEPAPDADGPVSGFEGAFLFAEGLYRPTADSKMRSLHRPFNPPALEALVLELHAPIPTIQAATPPGTLAGDEILMAVPVPVAGDPVTVTWSVDGRPVDAEPDGTLDLARHGPPAGSFIVSVVATDTTPLVRDEAGRAALMQEVLSWPVERAGCPADLDGDGAVEASDLLAMLAAWGCADCPGDLDADGTVGVADLLLLLAAWGAC